MNFYTKPPNFGVEAHMEAPAGDALRVGKLPRGREERRRRASTSRKAIEGLISSARVAVC
jgi:hypothetical protein